MAPAIALAGPQEPFSLVGPFNIAARQAVLVPIELAPGNVHPRLVLFGEEHARNRRQFGLGLAQPACDHHRCLLSAVRVVGERADAAAARRRADGHPVNLHFSFVARPAVRADHSDARR